MAVGGQFTLGHGEFVIGEAQKDQAQDGHRVFGGFELGVGAQFVGGAPEAFFEIGQVGGHDEPSVDDKEKGRGPRGRGRDLSV